MSIWIDIESSQGVKCGQVVVDEVEHGLIQLTLIADDEERAICHRLSRREAKMVAAALETFIYESERLDDP